MDGDEAVGARLRARRDAIGLTAEELALECGWTVARLLEYESGAASLTATQRRDLAELLETPPAYFDPP